MTLEEFVQSTGHVCNAMCRGRAVHAGVLYAARNMTPDEIRDLMEFYTPGWIRIDHVKRTLEAQGVSELRKQQQRVIYSGPGEEKDDSEFVFAYLVLFTLRGENEDGDGDDA